MTPGSGAQREVRLHLTNVTGTGATQLLKSLLPALENQAGARIADVHLPDRGELADYVPCAPHGPARRYSRRLPNSLSRILECTLFARRFDGDTPLLVLGDLPLRCKGPQVVFVQTPHLSRGIGVEARKGALKFAVARFVFRSNIRRADAIIVQTTVMRDLLERSYPEISGRVHVIAQPVPQWLLAADLHRTGPRTAPDDKLRLAYPAAAYLHKNHRLLAGLTGSDAASWPVGQLLLTVPPACNPAPSVPWVRCAGLLPPTEIVRVYDTVDALLFLSTDESYGFPLVEAMFVGIPIVCPDLPYARALCGNGAIYFDPYSLDSLRTAIDQLRDRLASGWWPNWSNQLASIPKDWDEVAAAMLDVVHSRRFPPGSPR